MTPVVAVLFAVDILGVYDNAVFERVVDVELTIGVSYCTDILLSGDTYLDARDRFVALTVYNCSADVVKWIKVEWLVVVARQTITRSKHRRSRETEQIHRCSLEAGFDRLFHNNEVLDGSKVLGAWVKL